MPFCPPVPNFDRIADFFSDVDITLHVCWLGTSMTELSAETLARVATLQACLLTIINRASEVEFILADSTGETVQTVAAFESLTNIIEKASDSYSRLANLQLRIARFQPGTPVAMIQMLTQTIEKAQLTLGAFERSIEEIKSDWRTG